MPRILHILPFLVFLAVAAYFAAPILQGRDPGAVPSVLVGKPAPELSLTALLQNKPGIDPTSLSGRVRVVNFFASWCLPCQAEHPQLMRIAANQIAPVYGVNYKDDMGAARDWLVRLGDPFERIGRDPDGRAAIEWGVYGVPETFVVDAGGRIRHRHVGPLTRPVLEQEIIPLLQTLGEIDP